jgi:hypothetical protein
MKVGLFMSISAIQQFFVKRQNEFVVSVAVLSLDVLIVTLFKSLFAVSTPFSGGAFAGIYLADRYFPITSIGMSMRKAKEIQISNNTSLEEASALIKTLQTYSTTSKENPKKPKKLDLTPKEAFENLREYLKQFEISSDFIERISFSKLSSFDDYEAGNLPEETKAELESISEKLAVYSAIYDGQKFFLKEIAIVVSGTLIFAITAIFLGAFPLCGLIVAGTIYRCMVSESEELDLAKQSKQLLVDINSKISKHWGGGNESKKDTENKSRQPSERDRFSPINNPHICQLVVDLGRCLIKLGNTKTINVEKLICGGLKDSQDQIAVIRKQLDSLSTDKK